MCLYETDITSMQRILTKLMYCLNICDSVLKCNKIVCFIYCCCHGSFKEGAENLLILLHCSWVWRATKDWQSALRGGSLRIKALEEQEMRAATEIAVIRVWHWYCFWHPKPERREIGVVLIYIIDQNKFNLDVEVGFLLNKIWNVYVYSSVSKI